MKKIPTLALCLGLGVLGGCASNQSLDELPPMPAAEPSVDDVNLANGMDEPIPLESTPNEPNQNNDLKIENFVKHRFVLFLNCNNPISKGFSIYFKIKYKIQISIE